MELVEYNGSYLTEDNKRHRFIPADRFVLIGLCQDLADMPYAPVIDEESPYGVGNIDAPAKQGMYFAKSWTEKDPSGRWIKIEARPLPVIQRPNAIVSAKVV